MSARVTWTGLDELRADLRNLPVELTEEASGIVIDSAMSAAQDIRTAYPKRTGNLANHVKAEATAPSRFGVRAVVKSTARHAHLFEYGTQARHTELGVDRGSMPPGNVFIPRMVKHRRAMYERLKAMLERHGLTVRGNA